MKKQLQILLMFLIVGMASTLAADYSGTSPWKWDYFPTTQSKFTTSKLTVALNGVNWTISTPGYVGQAITNTGQKGAGYQFGSGGAPASLPFTIRTSDFSNKTITQVSVKAAIKSADKENVGLSVSVGGTAFTTGSDNATYSKMIAGGNSTTPDAIVFSGNASGEIVISYDKIGNATTASSTCYLRAIEVTFSDGSTSTELGDIVAKIGDTTIADGDNATAMEDDLLSVSCQNATSITVNGSDYSTPISLTPGTHTYSIKASNETSERTLSFTVNVTAKPKEASLAFAEKSIAKNLGDPNFDIEYTYTGSDSPTLSAVSDKESIVKALSATDGKVSVQIVGAGTAKITLTASAEGYTTVTDETTITVTDPNAPVTEYTLLTSLPDGDFTGYIVSVSEKKVWKGTITNKHGDAADVTLTSDGKAIETGVEEIAPVEFIRNSSGKYTVKSGEKYLAYGSSSTEVSFADAANYQNLSITTSGNAAISLTSSRLFNYGTSDFRAYSTSSGNVRIFAIVTPPEAPEAPQFSVAEANVAYNTGLTISSKNASKIIYSITYNNDEAENIVNAEATGNSMTLNIVRDCTISAKGCNSTSTTDAVGMSYTIVRPEAPTLSASGTYRQGSTISATAPEPCTIVYKVTNGETTVAEGTSQTNIWNYTLNSDCMVEVYSLLPNGYRSASSETADYTVSVDAPAKPVYTFNETEKSITFSAEGASTIKVKAYNIDGTVAEETSYPADAATVSGCNSMRARFEAVGLNSKDEPGEALDINVLSLLNRTEGNDVWTRVTSIDQITDGMVFAVVAHAYNMNGVDEKDYYMTNNVWGNSNKRTIKGSETTAITENHMSYENVPDDVARIKLEKRVSDEKWLLYLEKFYDGTNEKSGYLGQCDESNNGLSINDVTADKAAGYDVKMVERLTTSDGKTELELFPGALQFYSAETHPNFIFNSQNKVFGMYTNAAATVNNLPVYLYTRSLATQPAGDHYTANVSFAAEAQDLVRNEDQWFYQGWPENFEKGEVIVNVTGFDGATCVLHGEVPELPEENPAPTEAPRHRVSSDETHVHAYPQDNIRLLLDSNEKSLPIYADASRAENDRNLSVTFVPFSTSSLNFNGTTTALTTIGADSDDPVEYFNLQGLRIAYPQAGQILIRRHGDKVEKILF